MTRHRIRPYVALWLTLTALGAAARPAAAGFSYPVNDCVNTKQTQAGAYCMSALKAWAAFDTNGDAGKRDGTIQSAAAKLAKQWAAAETKASNKGTNCAETTLSVTQAQAVIDSAVTGLAGDVNAGLNLSTKSDAKCGNKALAAAAIACKQLLAADGSFIKKLANATGRDQKQAAARTTFLANFQVATAGGCPTTATGAGIQSRLDGIDADIVANTTISPNVDATQFTTISPTGTKYQKKQLAPQCVHGQPYQFFVKRGSVNKVLMYYEGGGACWDATTCGAPTCTDHIDADPNGGAPGFADLTNPSNPFRDWNIVFVPYCSCDIHYGDSDMQYTPSLLIHHHGFDNAKTAEKWAREHFLNPEVVFVTGSSAGAYGAWFQGPLLHFVWPATQFHVLADAGNGVITQDFLKNFFPNWRFTANLPNIIPGVKDAIKNLSGIPAYTEAVARFFPATTWAHYAAAYDGGSGGQTGFYNLMLNNNDLGAAVNWWTGSCAFNQVMVQQAQETAAALTTNNNYRYYIGTGSRHTMWGSNKVYTDTTGGVPTLVDWVNATLASSPPSNNDAGWTNVECNNCGLLLPGDVRPNPLQTPFVQVGSDVVVQCP